MHNIKRMYLRHMFGINCTLICAYLIGLVIWGVIAFIQASEYCNLTVNMHAVSLHSGQLLSLHNAQVLCGQNDNINIEVRP